MTTNLSSRAMLARLTITAWSARKIDKRVTHEATERENADAASGRFNKQLLAGVDAALKEISRIGTAARTEHYRLTLPWTDDGARILTAAAFMEYTRSMSAFVGQFNTAVDAFLADYPSARESARFTLGQMYTESDYPTADRIRAKFQFSTSVDPLPNAADFRVDLSADAVDAIKQDLEFRMKAAEADAMKDVWTRLFTAVQHMATQLPRYATGEIKRFNDTLVDNVQQIVDLLPALNLSNDPQLTKMGEMVRQQLTQVSAQTLRDDENARQTTANAAAALTRQLSGYMGEPAPVLPEIQTKSVEAQIMDLFAPRAAA